LHGQSQYVLPQVKLPGDIVASVKAQNEAIAIQAECSEYINDCFWALFSDRFHSLPPALISNLEGRFKTPGQRASFFA
jgi:hypothetical protein